MGFYCGRDFRPTHLVLNPAVDALEEGLRVRSLLGECPWKSLTCGFLITRP